MHTHDRMFLYSVLLVFGCMCALVYLAAQDEGAREAECVNKGGHVVSLHKSDLSFSVDGRILD